jgi:hypothetical protein
MPPRPGSRRALLEARRAAGTLRSYAWRDGKVVKARQAQPEQQRASRVYRHRADCVGCGAEIAGYNPGGGDPSAWCRDCAARTWRLIWDRDSGAPMPERLQALVNRENAVE